MDCRPSIMFSIPYIGRVGDRIFDERVGVGSSIDEYLSTRGVMLSENGVEFHLQTQGGETTYHVSGNTVLVRCAPIPQYGPTDRYDVNVFVEGPGKLQLVEGLKTTIAGLAPVKV